MWTRWSNRSTARAFGKEGEVLEVILKRFENPDETRAFEKGRFDVVRIGGMTNGRAIYEPGWEWSEHVAPVAGAPPFDVQPLGMGGAGPARAPVSRAAGVRNSPR